MPQMKHKTGDPCPFCYQELTAEVLHDKEMRRRSRIKESLKSSDLKGRPRNPDHVAICMLRNHGLKQKEIMARLNCSIGVVRYALKIGVDDESC